MKLSVGMITLNEERILEKTLASVREIADEIIIVDSFSKDRTVEIAESFGAKVYPEKWIGFGPQKNSVIEKCSGDWILLIDADEELSKELVDKIKSIINGKNEFDVYKINRSSVCFGKRIRYGGWSNQYATRLWKKDTVKINNNLVHEEFLTDKNIGMIKEIINHYSYMSLEDYLTRFNRYTSLGAKEYHRRGKKANLFGIVVNPMFKFIRMYFIRLGFLDGLEGFLLAILSSNYTMVKYYKLLEMNRRESNGN